MTIASRLIRAACAAALLAPLALPAVAGEAETAYLHSLAGDWTGKGKVEGANGGNVACRIVFKPVGEKVNFTGKCNSSAMQGGQSFSGSIRYNDQRKRYESSTAGITVGGEKNGASITFTTSEKTIQGQITSTMTVSPRSMKLGFSLVDPKGAKTAGTISYSKS